MALSCSQFTDFLSRRAEHLDDEITRDFHPRGEWVGHVSVGRFKAEDGVEHTFDRFNYVYPDLSGPWEDVTAASCVGKPCDPAQTLIGIGFTRDSYKLQRRTYGTDLFCFDQILSADRAKKQFAHIIYALRRAASLITSHRFRTEALRIAKYKWAAANNTLTPITAYWDATQTILNVSVKPTSKMGARHLQRRVSPQLLEGALTTEIIGFAGEPNATKYGAQPMLEFVDDMEEIWNITEGNPELSDHWRFNQWAGEDLKKFYKYGWVGNCGNFALRADVMPLRFLDLQKQNADGTFQLQVVFPYKNIPATEGIKEELNQNWQDAPIQLDFIWHRMAMTSLVRDSAAINPEMPFAMRDFAGKWMFAMDNLTCGTDVNGNPIAVDNSWRNKGKFQAMWSFATQAEHPEFAEAFLVLREPACVVDIPRCANDPGYPAQSYASSNAICPGVSSTLTFTPVLNPVSGTYQIPRDSILCNGLNILNPPIDGSTTLAALVVQFNSLLAAMGTWAVASATTITLTGAVCQSVVLPFVTD
jgi:hypothetical protein